MSTRSLSISLLWRKPPSGRRHPVANRQRTPWPASALLLVLLVFTAQGCFFSTRTPEEPILGGGCDYDFLFNDSWQAVLGNMEGALGCGDASEYLKVLNGQFVYVPTPSLVGQYPTAFSARWGKDREEIFIQDAFASALFSASLTDSILSGPDEDGSIVRLTARYRIEEVDAEGNPVPGQQPYVDTARFEFLRGAIVELTVWEDLGTGRSFGERRGEQGGGL